MADVKIILLIGRSGRGKSALANVITNTNEFKESSSSVSETRKIQPGNFKENNVDYQIIDTPGIGDTKMSDSEVLDIIAEAVYRAKDGVGQVFFVTNGRFDQYEMATYDLLRTIIFDKDITKHTTIARTNFKRFEKPDRCEKNTDEMIKEAKEKRIALEQNISTKEKELANLSSTEIRYQELSAEIEKEKKELVATNLAEILESCERRIVYVDNPSLEDEEKLEINKGKRDKSRKILLKHLNENCQGDSYNPANLKELSEEIADDYFQYLNKKAELQRELDEEMKRLNFRASQSTQAFSSLNVPLNQAELTTEEKPAGIQENLMIIDKKEHDKIIAQLQDKKEKLKKEIAEKEKIIHQKVLKHIFNNYEAINKELGGDIFLSSVTGEHPWPEIHSEFTNKELVIKWLSQGFDYFQTQNWAVALIDFSPQIDADFCAWLRDKKQLTVEGIKRASYPQNIERWRKEYVVYLKKEAELLGKHNEQLGRDWTVIHEDFAAYQQYWEDEGFTYHEAQEWIKKGLKPSNCNEAKWWKYQGLDSRNSWTELGFKLSETWKIEQWMGRQFDFRQVAELIKLGLKPEEYELAVYLRGKDYQPNIPLNLEQLKGEFNIWKKKGSSQAQKYLDKNYPQEQKSTITKLDIHYKNLKGSLDLSDFINLEELDCSDNELTFLNLDNCLRLKEVRCYDNQLARLDLTKQHDLKTIGCRSNCLQELKLPLTAEQLTYLNIGINNLSMQKLSVFSRFANLEELYIDNFVGVYNQERIKKVIYNRFVGSLESLKNLKKLKILAISNTDIDSGLEYLPESIEDFACSTNKKFETKVRFIEQELRRHGEPRVGIHGDANFADALKDWRKYHQAEKQTSQILQTTTPPFNNN